MIVTAQCLSLVARISGETILEVNARGNFRSCVTVLLILDQRLYHRPLDVPKYASFARIRGKRPGFRIVWKANINLETHYKIGKYLDRLVSLKKRRCVVKSIRCPMPVNFYCRLRKNGFVYSNDVLLTVSSVSNKGSPWDIGMSFKVSARKKRTADPPTLDVMYDSCRCLE